MTKHTPGEWLLQGSTVRSGGYIIHDPPGSPKHPQLKADSQLISAAPDLLAALVLIEELDRKMYAFDDAVEAWVWDEAILAARDAILKARGET